jgi:hypothetical protein
VIAAVLAGRVGALRGAVMRARRRSR